MMTLLQELNQRRKVVLVDCECVWCGCVVDVVWRMWCVNVVCGVRWCVNVVFGVCGCSVCVCECEVVSVNARWCVFVLSMRW